MKRRMMLGLALLLVGGEVTTARAVGFDSGSLRGRYTGHLNVGATFSDGTTTQRLEVQLLTALKFDGKAAVEGASRITVAVPGQMAFTCPFSVTGTYEIAETGLGTATLVLVPSDPACGDSGPGVTLQASLAVGGERRRRLDVSISGGTDPSGEVLPITGAGMLEK